MSEHNYEDGARIDGARSCSLHDVGGTNLLAATLVGWDFTALAIVDTDRLSDGAPLDPQCRSVEHEQLGQLPIAFVKRITVSRRRPNPEEQP
jgi:hypothetical protein